MIQNKKIGNSRYVFYKLTNDFNQWQGTLGKIDNFIRENSGFERANPDAFIWFLPKNVNWVGREVIGSLPIKGDQDPYILDFKMSEIFVYPLTINLDWTLDDFLILKKKICQDNQEMIDGSLPWRIRLDLEKLDHISLEIEFFGQNYPFPKLTN